MSAGLAHAMTTMHITATVDDRLVALRRLLGQRQGQTTLVGLDADTVWIEALAQALSVGDRIVAIRSGVASAAWAERAAERGLVVETIDVAPGQTLPALELSARLERDRDGDVKAVFVPYSEPVTGMRASVRAIREAMDAADHPALLLVDATDSLPALPVRFEAWGVDVMVAAGGMMPGDTTLMATGHRTTITGLAEARPSRASLEAIDAQLDALFDEGLDAVQARYGRYAEAARRAIRTWGLEPIARGLPQPASVTAVRAADGTIITIAHGTARDETTLLARIEAAEHHLRERGLVVVSGAGVSAAAGWLLATGTTALPVARA